jgi:outer membrane protein assembly factor BamA
VPFERVASVDSSRGALAPVWPDTTTTASRLPAQFALGRGQASDSTNWQEGGLGIPGQATYAVREQAYRDSMVTVDSLKTARAGINVRDASAPFLLPDSLLSQAPHPYRRRFSTEFATGQLGFNSAFGLAGSSILSVSDFLGNDRFLIATDIFSGSLDETNILAYYYYLPKRWDYGFGVFHYKNYYYSNVTQFGEQFTSARRFADRNVGFSALASYPLNRFKRFDFDLTNVIVDRSFFDVDQFGDLVKTGSQLRMVTAPSASFVNDTGLYGYYGPVSGTRYYLYGTTALPLLNKSLRYVTLAADWRKYFALGGDYQFAMRGTILRSTGRDAQVFEAGGFSTFRGYQDFSILGTNVAFTNLEFRFPFINALGVVGPVPLGFLNLRGAVFADAGAVWSRDKDFQLTTVDASGTRRFDNFHPAAGAGIRSALGYFLVKLDVAWPYFLDKWGRPRWHFSLSPDF